jgi:beta-lactamase regulating signal transducer with metallopeptidase domain
MNEFYQSPILYALGWAIAGNFWQMGLLWLVHQLVFALPFHQKPGVKHGAAVLLLGFGSGWFLLTFFQQLYKARDTRSYIYRIDSDVSSNSITPSITFNGFITEAEKFLPYFSAAYLFVLVFLFFRLAQGFIITQQISNNKQLQPSMQWQHFVDRLCVQMNINREILVYLSETINVPATVGFLKPVILLPVATLNQLTISQAEAIILHEIAHIKRFDYFINIIVSIIETLLFFNPFARLLSVSIRKERELCCDDFVIGFQRDPQSYAHALLSLEKSRNTRNLAIAATGKESLLLGRVKRILQVPDQQIQYRHHLMALFIVATLIMFMAILNPPRTHKYEYPEATTSRLEKQENENIYYSLPTIFNSIQKELHVASGQDKIVKSRESKPVIAEKKNKKRSNSEVKVQHYAGFNGTPLPIEDGYIFAFPDGPGAAVAPEKPAGMNHAFNFKRSSDQKEIYERRPSPVEILGYLKSGEDETQRIRKFREDEMPGFRKTGEEMLKTRKAGGEMNTEFFQLNEESLLKFYNMIELENILANEEKIKVAIAAQRLENPVPKVRTFQNKIIRKRNTLNEDDTSEMKAHALNGTKEVKKSKPFVRTFSGEDGTVISIIQDNGKIEITLKDNR